MPFKIRNPNSKIDCPLHAAAQAVPEAPAVVTEERTLSYAELDRLVAAAAAALRERGWGDGAHVGLYGAKDWRYLVLLWALFRAGGVACPLSTRIPAEGIADLLRRAGCSGLITDRPELGGPGTERAEPRVLVDGAAASPSGPVGPLALEAPATLVFTSGSTGAPKAALHAFGNHYYSALGSNENIRLGPGDRWLLSLPLYHVGGLAILFRCVLGRAAVVVPPPGEAVAQSVAARGVTHVSMVATQLLRLLRDGGGGAELRAVLLGGSALPEGAVVQAHAQGLPVFTSYGLTEMSSQVATTPPDASLDRLRTSGRVLPYREVRIAPDGEILVRGRTLFEGYLKEPARHIDPSLDEDGWFHTGDVGGFDEAGYLSVVGRKDNLFISGGENIQPEEIERALSRLPGVRQAVVVAVPDAEFGARPVAFVASDAGLPPERLREELERTLPRFKIPVAFYPWPEASGGMKPDRAALRREALRRRQERGA